MRTPTRPFLSRHRDAETPQESLKYLQALASFDDEAAVDRTFELIADGTVRNQDTTWVLARMLTNRKSGPHAWANLRVRWGDMADSIPPMTHSRMLEGLPALSRPRGRSRCRSILCRNPPLN